MGSAAGSPGLRTDGLPKIPVHVAAAVAAAAGLAEAIDFTVGAEPERLRRAIAEARTAAATPDLGAFVNVAVADDRATARQPVRGSVAILARFATEGAPPTGLSEVTHRGIERSTEACATEVLPVLQAP